MLFDVIYDFFLSMYSKVLRGNLVSMKIMKVIKYWAVRPLAIKYYYKGTLLTVKQITNRMC